MASVFIEIHAFSTFFIIISVNLTLHIALSLSLSLSFLLASPKVDSASIIKSIFYQIKLDNLAIHITNYHVFFKLLLERK